MSRHSPLWKLIDCTLYDPASFHTAMVMQYFSDRPFQQTRERRQEKTAHGKEQQ